MSTILESGTPPKKSKSDKRQERVLQRIEKNKQKNIRLADSVATSPNVVRANFIPDFINTPRLSVKPENYKITNFTWCVTRADRDGQWSWGEQRNWSDDEHQDEIEHCFNNLLNNTWNDIETQTYNGAGHRRKLSNKYQPIESICDEAIERWISNPELAQFEELFRFRRGTNKRIWGVRIFSHFFTIWYERHHRICPIDDN